MIYLDSAATTLQKPPQVARAVSRAVNTLSSPGRGGHRAARAAAQTAFDCREEAAGMFGIRDAEQVVLTFNATHGLNIAIHSLVKPGDTVLISGYEHNAVTRPLHAMENVTIKVADAPLFQPEEMVRCFEQKMTPEVSVVICTHVSNVFGYILPVDEIAQLCARRGKPLIVDASQSAGRLRVEPERWGAAFVAMPGHKGLFGPQGTGLLLCSGDTRPILHGGTGSESLRQTMPEFLPDRLEAGTHNMPGVAGLLEGLRYVRRTGVDRIEAKERQLIGRLVGQLTRVPKVRLYVQEEGKSCQSGVLSLQLEGLDCEQAAQRLDEMGFALRAGLHCAPLAHRTAGTLEQGTIRLSVSPFNTADEMGRFAGAIGRLVK